MKLAERTVDGLHNCLFELLGNVMPGSACASAVDIGCGTGAWLERLKPLGFTRLVGLDHEAATPVDGLDLLEFDINCSEGSSLGKFDIVTCIEVIEHIENIGKLLDLISELLHEDGVAVISTPNIESLRARIRALVSGRIPGFDHKSDPTHLCPIIMESLQKMLQRRHLEIAKVFQYPAKKKQTKMFSRPVNWLSIVLDQVLPNELYGDNTIYLIRSV
jgi:2-polyprenyl-3-methyl-5-hydroxy-6-metoxy-1,4-benzoquinol methylase